MAKEYRIFVEINDETVILLPLWACSAYHINPDLFHKALSGEVIINLHNREDLYRAAGYYAHGVSFDWAVPMGWHPPEDSEFATGKYVWIYQHPDGRKVFSGEPLADSVVVQQLKEQIHEALQQQCYVGVWGDEEGVSNV